MRIETINRCSLLKRIGNAKCIEIDAIGFHLNGFVLESDAVIEVSRIHKHIVENEFARHFRFVGFTCTNIFPFKMPEASVICPILPKSFDGFHSPNTLVVQGCDATSSLPVPLSPFISTVVCTSVK